MSYEYDDEPWGPPEQNPGRLAAPLTTSELVAEEDSVEEAAHQAEIGFWDAHYDAATNEAEADGS